MPTIMDGFKAMAGIPARATEMVVCAEMNMRGGWIIGLARFGRRPAQSQSGAGLQVCGLLFRFRKLGTETRG